MRPTASIQVFSALFIACSFVWSGLRRSGFTEDGHKFVTQERRVVDAQKFELEQPFSRQKAENPPERLGLVHPGMQRKECRIGFLPKGGENLLVGTFRFTVMSEPVC